ncbi:hypothetical protein ABE473_01635 [Stenotrophomonas sp. TWI700]|uniref:hypothetical protein n=1 Tax=Stenotrophomonas sp. TWI700 TaxID=3136792 RepID=UPI003209B38E
MSWKVLVVLAALLGGAEQADAADAYISAEFTPDVRDPSSRSFTNTTPWSGLCSHPVHNASCVARNIFGIDTNIRGTKYTTYGTLRGAYYFGMPAERNLLVTGDDGVQHQLLVRINGMGFRYEAFNGSSGSRVMNGCTVVLTNYGAGNPSAMRLFQRNDDAVGSAACSSGWVNRDGEKNIEELDVVYELVAPNPLEMSAGVYAGSTTYTIGGAGMDIDLGDGVSLDASELTLHFTLKVNHYFDVRFPPGSHRAVLSPLGGWTQWTEQGRAPTALAQEVPFSLSSSSLFGVTIRCQYPLPDGRCGIRSGTAGAADVPLDLRLTIPGAHDRTLGRSVVDYPLTTNMAAPLFDPQGYIYERPSRLGIRVDGAPLAEMLRHPGSRYAGDVTVIFDVDL